MPKLLHRSLLGLAAAFSMLLATLAVIALLRPTGWPFELFNHFVLAAAFLSVGSVATAILLDARRLLIGCLFTLGAFSAILGRSYDLSLTDTWTDPLAAASVGSPAAVQPVGISLLTHNVYCRNWNLAGLRAWLANRPADVVVLVEVPLDILNGLADLSDTYPYSASIAASDTQGRRGGCQGVLVLSTLPIVTTAVFQPLEDAWPGLIVRLAGPTDGGFWLAAIHASDPVRQPDLGKRDRFLDTLTTAIADLDGPLVVAGDFNATPFTPVFQRFLGGTGLVRPTRPIGSYPARFGGFGLPIDHILARDAMVREVEALVGPGSDHRPIRARIEFTQRPLRPFIAQVNE